MNDTVGLELTLQAVNSGYFVNVVSVDGDVIRVKSTSPKMIRVNGKFKSMSSLFDGNGGNNRGSFSFNVNKDGSSNDGSFEWPDKSPEPDEDETPKPDEDPVPPTPPTPPTPPEPSKPSTRLEQDIFNVRSAVSTSDTSDDENDFANKFLSNFLELGSIPDDLLVPPTLLAILIKTMQPFTKEISNLLKTGSSATEYLAASILAASSAVIVTGLISAMLFYIWYIILTIKSLYDKGNKNKGN